MKILVVHHDQNVKIYVRFDRSHYTTGSAKLGMICKHGLSNL
jgi:hypothetical protein